MIAITVYKVWGAKIGSEAKATVFVSKAVKFVLNASNEFNSNFSTGITVFFKNAVTGSDV
jgi:hypothetical protein